MCVHIFLNIIQMKIALNFSKEEKKYSWLYSDYKLEFWHFVQMQNSNFDYFDITLINRQLLFLYVYINF